MSKVHKLLRIPFVVNKSNGQVNLSLPRKKIDIDLKKKIKDSKFARIWLEDFD